MEVCKLCGGQGSNGSQGLSLQAIMSNGVATVRQTLSRVFSAESCPRSEFDIADLIKSMRF
jgi:hypothetical protein